MNKGIEKKIDVIIPVLDRREDTIKTLNSLFLNNKNINVIIVDNGSDDLSYLDKYDVIIIENNENKGVVYAFNQGLDIVKSDYIVVMHNDLVVNTKDWIDKAIKFMEENEDVGIVGIAGFKKLILGHGWPGRDLITAVNKYNLKPSRDFEEVAVVDGCCNIIRDIGLRFDNIFGIIHFYDYDISMQYRKQGYRIFVMNGDANHSKHGSTIGNKKYINTINKSNGEYYSEREKIFTKKWKDYLPAEII